MSETAFHLTAQNLDVGLYGLSVSPRFLLFPSLQTALFIYTSTSSQELCKLSHKFISSQPHLEVSQSGVEFDRVQRNRPMALTSVTVIEVGELVPLVVLNQAEECPFHVRSHLNDKWMGTICGEAGSDEGDVESSTK